MAQDESYQTTVYFQQGGNRAVAASGGTLAIESGGSMLLADSGALTIGVGGDLSIPTGVSMGIAGTTFSPAEFTRLVVSEQLMDSAHPGAGDTTLAVSNLPDNLGTYMFGASGTLQSASFWLPAVSAGREVYIGVWGDSTGTFDNDVTQVAVSTSGCIILGSTGGIISNFTMNTSAAEDVLVHLIAVTDNVWAIISERGSVVYATVV